MGFWIIFGLVLILECLMAVYVIEQDKIIRRKDKEIFKLNMEKQDLSGYTTHLKEENARLTSECNKINKKFYKYQNKINKKTK